MRFQNLVALLFMAGLLGGIANAFAVFYSDDLGLTALLNLDLSPAFNKEQLYSKMVWGGVWGLIFILPIELRRWPFKNLVVNGVVLSLLPSMLVLLYLFPEAGKGLWGFDIGALMPAYVIAMNIIWGLVSVAFIRFFKLA